MSDSCHGRGVKSPCDGPDLKAKRPDNRPALDAIRYRIGAHGDFTARMLHAIPRATVTDRATGVASRPLKSLTVRTADDPTVALIDAFACSLDVLTFYQERIANEGYIRTATERMSVLELSRAIDYELRPGVAASASLAFTVESSDDPYRVVDVPAGTQVMSVPKKPSERPQIFETVETITARAEWNAIPARTERPQNLAMFWKEGDEDDAGNGTFYLLDIDTAVDLSDEDPADLVAITQGNAADYLPATPGLDLAAVLADLAEDAALNPEIEPVIKGLRVEHIEIRGIGLGLAPGGRILSVAVRRDADGAIEKVRTRPFRIDGVAEDRDHSLTRVQLGGIDAAPRPLKPPKLRFRPAKLRLGRLNVQPVAFNATTAQSVVRRATWSSASLSAFVRIQAWPRVKLMRLFRQTPEISAPALGEANPGFYVLRQSVAFFGHAAPKWETLAKPDETRGGTGSDPYKTSWEPSGNPRSVWSDSQGNPLTDAHVFLEREVTEAVPEGWALFETPSGETRAFRIARSATQSRADFALSGRATGLTLRDPNGDALDVWGNNDVLQPGFGLFDFRTAVAKVGSEALTLGGLPITEAIEADSDEVSLDGLYLDLKPGISVSLVGERSDAPGVTDGETCLLNDVIHVGGFTRLSFTDGLAYSYKRTSLRVNANVAPATHGEHKPEALGSGDATLVNQAFKLAKPPLTFISAATNSGTVTTLEVRVDGILWTETASLYDAGPDDEVYIVRIDDDGTTRVVFGDGIHGKRLPTGALNVTASYRSGMGTEGEVGEESLTLLKTRPLGIRAVTNLLAAKGAAGAEPLDEARTRGPQSVRTLGRIVSLTDYEDFARSFAGIGKARASTLWRGRKRLIHLTVSPATEGVFAAADKTLTSLAEAVDRRRDPGQTLIIAPHTPRFFRLSAKVAHDPRYLADAVREAITARLMEAFGYGAASLAEPVSAAAVIAEIQDVPGVAWVDLDAFATYDEANPDAPATLATVLPARTARLAATSAPPDIEPAELLCLFEAGIELTVEGDHA